MTLTPRQIAAYLEFSDKIDERMRKAIIGSSDGRKD